MPLCVCRLVDLLEAQKVAAGKIDTSIFPTQRLGANREREYISSIFTALGTRMRFIKEKDFGPFSDLRAETLGDLSVLTGRNGSGKTQFLKAIKDGSVSAVIDGVALKQSEIAYIPAGLIPKLTTKFTLHQAFAQEDSASSRLLVNHRASTDDPQLDLIAAIVGKTRKTLLAQEVRALAIATHQAKEGLPFVLDLARESMAYLRTHYHQMNALYFHEKTDDGSLAALTSEELLVHRRPPPWELVSSVLAPFGFQVMGPTVDLLATQQDLQLSLRNSAGDTVPPDALSGGEQTLVALALAQYAASNGAKFPRLLLLDESLSSLHPSVVKRALETLQSVFVEKNDTRVLLVTHSPTVIALASPRSLYQVENQQPSLQVARTSVDVALGLLTEGVPTLRIDTANQRQVLVEAQQDQVIYSGLYRALSRYLEPSVSLNFIACGRTKSEGGRQKVEHLLKEFRGAGASTVHGVVDWDSNSPKEFGTHAIADGVRYSVENVLLDPLLVALALAQTERGRSILSRPLSQTDIGELDERGRQSLTDEVVGHIAKASGRTDLDEQKCTVAYCGGKTVEVPAWVLRTRGHDYAAWVLQAFPMLQAHHAGPNTKPEDRLVAFIGENLAMNVRDFLPSEILHLFKSIQSSQP